MSLRERITRVLRGSRDLVRIVYRDPEHVSERLTLYAHDHLARESQEWADAAREARPDEPIGQIAEELRTQSANIARVDGAIAGTPFLIALVPGYVTFLWQEARMSLRTAALYGHDPGAFRTSAEVLVLRGVHPTVEAAEEALGVVRDAPEPEAPTERRSLRTWYRSGYALLVFGGFLNASKKERAEGVRGWALAGLSAAVGAAIWLTTWVVPFTFMIVMAWACESHTRQLGRRAAVFFGGEAATPAAAIKIAGGRRDEGHDRRQVIRTVALALSVAVPLAFVLYADKVRNSTGITWVAALGALVALSLVLATAMVGARR